MTKRFSRLKNGSQIVLGHYVRYFAGGGRMIAEPIMWTKCADDLLISSMVIDYMTFDAKEADNGYTYTVTGQNNNYPLSNIHQYLNAYGGDWFLPTHEHDVAPDYANHPGFLTWFSPDELNILRTQVVRWRDTEVECLVRLPCSCELIPGSGATLPFFKKHGRRAYATFDGINGRFRSYCLMDPGYGEYGVSIMCESGQPRSRSWASERFGIRPIIRVDHDAIFACDDTGENATWYQVVEDSASTDTSDSMFEALFDM